MKVLDNSILTQGKISGIGFILELVFELNFKFCAVGEMINPYLLMLMSAYQLMDNGQSKSYMTLKTFDVLKD